MRMEFHQRGAEVAEGFSLFLPIRRSTGRSKRPSGQVPMGKKKAQQTTGHHPCCGERTCLGIDAKGKSVARLLSLSE
jgi:hypothetical protein